MMIMTAFDRFPERRQTRSVKWDMTKAVFGSKDVQPLWVADMDFEVAPEIKSALKARIDHGIFGYTYTDKSLNQVIKDWLMKRHQFEVALSSIIYSSGVLETIHMALLTQTKENDKVLIQTPVYPPFHSMVKQHNRELVTNPLIYQEGRYTIDFKDLEEKFRSGVKAMIFCSPHNPVGRVWTKNELVTLLNLVEKYNVLLISDEIHADLTYAGHKHIPIGSIDTDIKDRIITVMSPTKSFNLAGLQVSYAVIPDKKLREDIEEAFRRYGRTMLNTIGITALEAAYTKGEAWLDDLLAILETNKILVEETLKDRTDVSVIKAEGTYLLWLDFNARFDDHDALKTWAEKEAKVGLNSGITFGENGKGFLRINIGSPTTYVREALLKLTEALNRL